MSSMSWEDIETFRKKDLLYFLDCRAQHLSEEAKELLVEKLYIMIYVENYETKEIPETLSQLSE